MMEDLKISAVFSLVGSSNDADTFPKSSIADVTSSTDECSSPGEFFDDDLPPTLTSVAVRNSDSAQTRSCRNDNDTPPVLQPEEMPRQATEDKSPGNVCRNIAPSYIVLKNVKKHLGGKSSISFRKFKRVFSDCTNMCKKMYFIRRLKSGKDVFNVKTPSKQIDYLLYLEQNKSVFSKKNKPSNTKFKSLKSILNKNDNSISESSKSSVNQMKRVRRTVAKVPKDFRSLISIMNKRDHSFQNETNYGDDERAKRQVEWKDWDQHAIDVLVLRKQIAIKRSHNKKVKKLKSKPMSNVESILKSQVTSNVSGRVCKRNPKYLTDFAVDKTEINEQLCVEKTNNELKKLVHDTNLMKRKHKVSKLDNPPKKSKLSSSIVIENPEEESVTCFKTGLEVTKAKQSKRKSKSLTQSTVAKTNTLGARHSDKREKDGVLIQEMPNEGSVIADILQSKPSTLSSSYSSINDSSIKIGTDSTNSTAHNSQPVKTVAKTLPRAHGASTQTSILKSPDYNTNNCRYNVSVSSAVHSQTSQNQTNKPILVKTHQGLKYIMPSAGSPVLLASPKLSTPSVPTSAAPMVVTVKGVGNAQSLVHQKTLRPTLNVITSRSQQPVIQRGNSSLLASSNSLLPLFPLITTPSASQNAHTVILTKSLLGGMVPNTNSNIIGGPSSGIRYQLAEKVLPSTSQKSQAITVKSDPIPTVVHSAVRHPNSISVSVIGASPGTNTLGTTTFPAMPEARLQLIHEHIQSTPSVMSQTLTTSTASTLLTSGSVNKVSTTEKSKFYLLKIDGKNVLIPVEGSQFQPKAYVVNSDVIGTTAVGTITTAGLSSATSQKPTLIVEPSVKVVNPQSIVVVPPIKIKEEPLDDWSEHLMKTPVTTTNTFQLDNDQRHLKQQKHLINLSNLNKQWMAKQGIRESNYKKIVSETIPSIGVNKNESGSKINDNVVITSAISDISRLSNSVNGKANKPTAKHDSITKTFPDPKLCIDTPNQTSTTKSEEDKKPVAFTEALTAREERLRRLKELLKEKEKAVEAIRGNKTEN